MGAWEWCFQVAKGTGGIGRVENRRQQLFSDALASAGWGNANKEQVPMRVRGMTGLQATKSRRQSIRCDWIDCPNVL